MCESDQEIIGGPEKERVLAFRAGWGSKELGMQSVGSEWSTSSSFRPPDTGREGVCVCVPPPETAAEHVMCWARFRDWGKGQL